MHKPLILIVEDDPPIRNLVSVALDSTSTWTLTADTWIDAFEGDASCVTGNGYTLYVNGTALEGIS